MRRTLHAPDWLTARPIAHRGLHGAITGHAENSLASAQAAIAKGYAIECDIQLSRDGEAIVFHDFDLDRLTEIRGRLADFPVSELAGIAYRNGEGCIPSLPMLLAEVAGRVPLIVEVKSAFDDDIRLADRAAEIVATYSGPLALKSFDPAVLLRLRAANVACPVGLVAQASYESGEWPLLDPDRRKALADLRQFPDAAPDFLSWSVHDLPHAVPTLCRELGLPIMTWTVRTPAQRAQAAFGADQIVFEGFEA